MKMMMMMIFDNDSIFNYQTEQILNLAIRFKAIENFYCYNNKKGNNKYTKNRAIRIEPNASGKNYKSITNTHLVIKYNNTNCCCCF